MCFKKDKAIWSNVTWQYGKSIMQCFTGDAFQFKSPVIALFDYSDMKTLNIHIQCFTADAF